MNTFLRDILTGIDGVSFAIIKVLGFLVVAVFMALEIIAFFTGKPFDGYAYGIGAAAAIAAMGAAIKLTENSEPKA
jgi:uncharacterized membrane protein